MQSLALDDLLELIIRKTPTYSILDTLMTNSLISIFQRHEKLPCDQALQVPAPRRLWKISGKPNHFKSSSLILKTHLFG